MAMADFFPLFSTLFLLQAVLHFFKHNLLNSSFLTELQFHISLIFLFSLLSPGLQGCDHSRTSNCPLSSYF